MSDTSYSMDRWRGKVALVTGASSGIGRAAALALAADGMRVAITARRRQRLEALAGELRAAGAEVLSLPADFMHEDQILALFAQLRNAWGGVDVLINNAGLGHRAPIADGDPVQWREEIEINLFAAALCAREAVRDMRERSSGAVVTLASIAAQRVPLGKNVTMYSAAKHAIRAVSTGLWNELARDDSPIKIGLISPGTVETQWHATAFDDAAQARAVYETTTPLSVDDIVAAMRYMLSAPAHVQINEITLRPLGQKE